MAQKIRVLVVDDSALMRKHLRELLTDTGEFEVTVARDGRDALAMLPEVNPDVVTLDINMPEMDGLTCLSRIMTERPKPVVMVSSLTAKNAEVTYEALALGAVDYVQKPDGTISLNLRNSAEQIIAKVRAAAGARVGNTRGLRQRMRSEARGAGRTAKSGVNRAPLTGRAAGLVLVGVSTGGPRVLEEILPLLASDLPWPVLVAQHMPATFTGAFAKRLNGICELDVAEVAQRTALRPGCCYIGRGDADTVVLKRNEEVMATAVPADASRMWHPSVARMVESALTCLDADRLIGVMLTGMGDDGAVAMTELRKRGGRTIAEAESTAAVFGMPAELIKHGGAEIVLPADRIAKKLTEWLNVAAAQST